MRRLFGFPLCLLVCVLGLCAGCSEEISIRYQLRTEALTDLTVIGLRHEACSRADASVWCLPPDCGRLDFVMETNRSHFVVPGMELEGLDGPLSLGTNFGGQPADIVFASGWLFQLDAKGLDQACATDADCASGFECRTLSANHIASNDVSIGRSLCMVIAQVRWVEGSLTFTALGANPQPDNPQSFGRDFDGLSLAINVDNADSFIGRDPVSGQIATDLPNHLLLNRIAALKSFRAELLDSERPGLIGRSEFALLALSGFGSTGVFDVYLHDDAFKTSFLTDNQISAVRGGRLVFDATLDGISTMTGDLSPLWEGLLESAYLFADGSVVRPNYARRALLFADSPSDGSSKAVTVQTVIRAFSDPAVKASATILHLDSVEPSDQSNRTGPLADYQALACETGGYYVYDVWPKSLPDHARRLGRAYEGIWSAQIEARALVAGQVTPLSQLAPGWYRLASTMTVSLGDRTETFNFSAQKVRDVFNENADAYTDSRLLLEVK